MRHGVCKAVCSFNLAFKLKIKNSHSSIRLVQWSSPSPLLLLNVHDISFFSTNYTTQLYQRSRVRVPAVPLSVNNLGQVFAHMCLSPSLGTGHGAVIPCDWEGNRRSGIVLVMRHGL